MNDMTDATRGTRTLQSVDRERQPDSAYARLAHQIAPLAVDVLLQGETGVGKDMLAREIHRRSGRPGKFVAINCAAIPESLAESELFGHEAGAFTGAVRAREGKLEAADKGTLYLDEIDSMPLAAQAKLLRALQERGAERLGGSRFYRADFRVIASTKVALPDLIEEGRFRRDLYFRLNVVKIRIPALRDAREHILPLYERFVAEAASRHDLPMPALDGALRKMLLEHEWPGNVRELGNAAQRHVLGLPLLDDEAETKAQQIPAAPPTPPEALEGGGTLRDRLRAFERDVIVATLKRHQGSVARASTELQLPPNTLYYRIKTLGIQFQPE